MNLDVSQQQQLVHACRLVFWDFDGVIKESVAVKSQCFETLFLPYGRDVADRVRRHHETHTGVSRYEKIPIYLAWAGEPSTPEHIHDFCDRFAHDVRQAVIDAPWVPGVREYLLAYHTRQRFVLVTATPQEEMQQILYALELFHCFDEVYGAPTPKAIAIRDVLQSVPCQPQQALVIGDSDTDLAAAEANHVPFLLRRTVLNQTLQAQYSGPTFDDLAHE